MLVDGVNINKVFFETSTENFKEIHRIIIDGVTGFTSRHKWTGSSLALGIGIETQGELFKSNSSSLNRWLIVRDDGSFVKGFSGTTDYKTFNIEVLTESTFRIRGAVSSEGIITYNKDTQKFSGKSTAQLVSDKNVRIRYELETNNNGELRVYYLRTQRIWDSEEGYQWVKQGEDWGNWISLKKGIE